MDPIYKGKNRTSPADTDKKHPNDMHETSKSTQNQTEFMSVDHINNKTNL